MQINPMTEVAMELPEGTPIWEFPLPVGYTVRRYASAADRAAWVRIVAAAERYHAVIDERLHRSQFGDDEAIIAQRQLFLVSPEGRDIGTATAWFGGERRGPEWGRFHWLAIVPECQGRGLAKPLIAITLRRLRELGHANIWLTTEMVREHAIRIYLRFGFRPDLTHPHAPEAWRLLEQRLSARADRPRNGDET